MQALPEIIAGTKDERGNDILDVIHCEDGTIISVRCDAFGDHFIEMHHEDIEYLRLKLQNLLPDLPIHEAKPN